MCPYSSFLPPTPPSPLSLYPSTQLLETPTPYPPLTSQGSDGPMMSTRTLGVPCPSLDDRRPETVLSDGGPYVIVEPVFRSRSPRDPTYTHGCVPYLPTVLMFDLLGLDRRNRNHYTEQLPFVGKS